MGLFPTSNLAPDVLAANQVNSIAAQQYSQLARSGLQGYNLIWRNPAATPQAVIAALGANAVPIFQLAGLNLATIASAAAIAGSAPPIIPEVPAGWTLTPSTSNPGAMDVAPPPATVPTGLIAAAVGSGVALNWNAVVGTLSYTVKKSTDNGSTFTTLIEIPARVVGSGQVVAEPATAAFADPIGAATNQYIVAATTPAGTSAFSSAATA